MGLSRLLSRSCLKIFPPIGNPLKVGKRPKPGAGSNIVVDLLLGSLIPSSHLQVLSQIATKPAGAPPCFVSGSEVSFQFEMKLDLMLFGNMADLIDCPLGPIALLLWAFANIGKGEERIKKPKDIASKRKSAAQEAYKKRSPARK
jgi:hypothetical protein